MFSKGQIKLNLSFSDKKIQNIMRKTGTLFSILQRGIIQFHHQGLFNMAVKNPVNQYWQHLTYCINT